MTNSRCLQDIEAIHDRLGLTYEQIAAVIGADESSIDRWQVGDAQPDAVHLSRIAALHELQTELHDAMQQDAAHDWLTRNVPALGGRRPIDLLREGRIEPLTRLLVQLNAGIPV